MNIRTIEQPNNRTAEHSNCELGKSGAGERANGRDDLLAEMAQTVSQARPHSQSPVRSSAVRLFGCSAVLPLLLPLLLTLSCRPPAKPVTRQWTTMGTFASLTVSAPTAASLPANATLARDTFEALNQSLSTYIASSDVSRLNAVAGQQSIPVSPDTTAMLTLATRFSTTSGGAFDVTVLPLMRLWGFRNGQPPTALPDPAAVAATLPLVNYQRVEQGGGSARLTHAGMQIDLGGIAKGYAVDRAFDSLQRAGQRDLLINLGGNMRGSGRPDPSRPWHVGVRNPFNRAELLGTIALPDGYAVATSGNYEKFVEIDGTRYAHIMDPRTGRPVQGIAAVTILAPTAVAADALSTALFVIGLDGAGELLAHYPNTHAIIVPDRHPIQIHLSPGLTPHFTPLPTFKTALHTLPPVPQVPRS